MGRLCGQLYSWMMDAEGKSLTCDQSGTPVNSSYHKQVAKQKGREHRPEALALCRKLGYINSRSQPLLYVDPKCGPAEWAPGWPS